MTPDQLHRDTLVIDAHNDAIVSHIRRGHRSFSEGESAHLTHLGGTVHQLRGPLEASAYAWNGQVTFPKLRAGGVDAAFFAVDVTRAWKNHLAYAMDAFGFFLADADEHPDSVRIARTAEDITLARAEGRLAALLVIENSDALEGSLNILHAFHALGVVSMTLTHNPSSWAAAGNAEHGSGGGLTRFGRDLVREMDRLRMLVDVSHIAERGFYDVLETAERPVVASHSNCAALCPHPRNLSDDQLRALAQQGGVAGITFVPSFVDPGWRDEDWPRLPTLDQLLDHVDHAVEVAGVDHVAIGSDFDGGGTVLKDMTEFPRLTEGLVARSYPEAAIRKILGENLLRLLP
jgi:membrane dipeptidase